ncbi:MAG: hypothetical protein WD038_08150 [Balneolales bacterium]
MIQLIQHAKGPQLNDKSLGSGKPEAGDDSFSKQWVQAFQKKPEYKQPEQTPTPSEGQNGGESSRSFFRAISQEQKKGHMVVDEKRTNAGEQQNKNEGIGASFLLNDAQNSEVPSDQDVIVLPGEGVEGENNADEAKVKNENIPSGDDNASKTDDGSKEGGGPEEVSEQLKGVSDSNSGSGDASKLKGESQDAFEWEQLKQSNRGTANSQNAESAEEVKINPSGGDNEDNTDARQLNILKNVQGESGAVNANENPVPATDGEGAPSPSGDGKDVASKVYKGLEGKDVLSAGVDSPDTETQEAGKQLNQSLADTNVNQGGQKENGGDKPFVAGDLLKEAVEKELKQERGRLPLSEDGEDSSGAGNRGTTTTEKPLQFGSNYQGNLHMDEGAEQFMPKSSNKLKDTESLFLKDGQTKTEINETVAGRMQQPVMTQAAEPRAFVNRMLQVVRQELQNTQLNAQGWKVHQFSFDDGSKVQMGIRQIEGMLQLQLGSGNAEMNRLIQQNAAEIREYLEKEMGLDVDLQFNQKDSGSQLLNPDPNHQTKQHGKSFREGGNAFDEGMEEITNDKIAIRNFGFNKNEWTA